MIEQFTIGGFIASEALTWNEETYQRIGNIIFLLSKSAAKERRAGFIELYEMRRHFMQNDWYSMMKRLNDFRRGKGMPEIEEMADQVSADLSKTGIVQDIEKPIKFELPTLQSISEPAGPAQTGPLPKMIYAGRDTVSQMSLF
jgi:hypothetical protein